MMFPSQADPSFHFAAENLDALIAAKVRGSIFASFQDPHPVKRR
jgi:hypothetical protein